MDIQQQINLGILEAFEKEKIEMAYPTQKIYYINEREAT
jgi:small-conductance mechanosensitive channel